MHFGARAGRADARRRDAGDAAVHRRGAATPQMPARRRAPSRCGSQARWLCCSPPYIPKGLLVARAAPAGLGACSEVHHLFPDRPLGFHLEVQRQGAALQNRLNESSVGLVRDLSMTSLTFLAVTGAIRSSRL